MQNTSQILQKTHKKSFFITCNVGSNYTSDYILTDEPKYNKKSIVVLQIMHISEKLIVVEIVNSTDYES